MLNYYLKNLNERLGRSSRAVLLFLLIFIFPYGASAQTRNITGTITDASNGDPLIGAAVRVSGTSLGASTDFNGKFKLSIPESAKTIEISFLGYKAQTITLTAVPVISVKMEPSSSSLNEVVVVGYNTVKKKDLTGSVVQITPDRLANENPKTVQDILRGTPGLRVGMDVSAKGGGSLELRGQRSLYTAGAHNEPLIILDGMQFYGELSEINPDDIEQIDILKDASAAAVYGAKSASGVIIISTKKGKIGKPVINFNTSVGINGKSAYMNVFSPDEYMQYREDWYKAPTYGVNATTGAYEAYQNPATKPGQFDNPNNIGKYGITIQQWRAYSTNVAGESDASIYARRLGLSDAVLKNYVAGKTFDWFNQSFRTGYNRDYNVSVAGASDKINYYMSMGYLGAMGAVKGDDYSTVRANLKVDGKITDWLSIGANVNFQNRSDGTIQVGLGTNYYDANQVRNSPYASYLNDDGSLAEYPMGNTDKRGYNFDFEKQYVDLEKGYTVLNTIFNAKVKLPLGITYSFNASPRFQFFYNRYFTSAERPDTAPTNAGVDREQSKRYDYNFNNTVNWDKTFAKKHHFTATLVQEVEERRYWGDLINARNILPSDALGFHNTSNGDKTASSFSSTDTHQTANGLLGRLFYAFDERYLITASIRRDGYSAFGANNAYATFPSVAVGWTFTNEKFFHWTPMNLGKFRLSYGQNGNRSLDDPYVALANLASNTTMPYLDNSGNPALVKSISASRLANPNLRWEKSIALNAALDFGFFNDRINGSIEYYNIKTTDMIMNQPLPGFTGFSSIAANLGEVNNKGVEITVNTVNIRKKNFEWRTSLGFAYNANKIVHLFGTYSNIVDAAGNVTGQKEDDYTPAGWFIGQPISEIWDYRVTGIWQANEVVEAARYGQRPGDPKVANNYTADDIKNANGTTTPVYNDKDKEFLGQSTPPINWSLRNEFKLYKNFDVAFSIYSYMGGKSLAGYYLNGDNAGSLITYGFNPFAKKYWTPENPTNDYGRLAAVGPAGATGAQKLYNRSFIRLDNISVGYTLPLSLTSKINLAKVKLYGAVKNAAVYNSGWEYADPETGGLATRTYTFGLNVTF
ncbi:MAG: SusC/RagA family TonB-linked outer membrane protein [Mucilaginibacter sp.]|uniref:SusC/RagA family TonB-linked outer membrane protein n=1 Tax=Mucilaginibacter sp. TaxID=1882438 RepID=UPI0032669A8D